MKKTNEIKSYFNIDDYSQIKKLCKFIANNKDKYINIIINNKHNKFDSFIGKKRFAAGLEQGSSIVNNYTNAMVRKLKSDFALAEKEKNEYRSRYIELVGRLNSNNLIKQIRMDAYADSISELNDDRTMLKLRLDLVEPIIKLVVRAKTDGELQKAYKLAKKNGLCDDS